MEENEERFATKEEILKNLKRQYTKHRISYKEYMLQVKKTEKYYDQWKADYEAQKNGVQPGQEYDTTNEELAIGKKMEELQSKPELIENQEKELLDPTGTPEEIVYEEVPEEKTDSPDEEKTEE